MYGVESTGVRAAGKLATGKDVTRARDFARWAGWVNR